MDVYTLLDPSESETRLAYTRKTHLVVAASINSKHYPNLDKGGDMHFFYLGT